MNLLTRLAHALRSAVKVNRALVATPAAILWPDAERNWQGAIPSLAKLVPELLTLGAYAPERRQGPGIWLKCVVAGELGAQRASGTVPIIYLPGIARTDLRAIEDCPRDLQPLAELQFRGTFWSQANAKDWTPNAFLSAKNGGLGCDVAQDKPTQEALKRAFDAGVILDQTAKDLQGRRIDAAWLDSLLAPSPTRDILAWLNDSTRAQSQWAGARWEIFVGRCIKDFGFNPDSDGPLTAAEKLAEHQGAWSAVWELYSDSFTSFSAVAELLTKLKPPGPRGLFNDATGVSGYPRANDDAEAALRYQLHSCAEMPLEKAREALGEAEKEHGDRRNWLWAKMGRAPLAQALQHLYELALVSVSPPGGSSLAHMSGKYQDFGWKVDQAALHALAAVSSKADTDAVGAALRALYVPWLEDLANRFQALVKAEGRLAQPKAAFEGVTEEATPIGVCTVFVDGLRYDVAMRLKDRLAALGKVTVSAAWTSMPSVTASGKAWASPVAERGCHIRWPDHRCLEHVAGGVRT